ncbi:MAG: A/G-specific adenine glycosylase, partial [Novosphingobium sp.]|nr:A/G-specific adenine glycosylase [Novosphingobium sp.]
MDTRSGMIAAQMLDWYDAHARSLPWRAGPGEPPSDPYRVWLSEVMLQQTTTTAVIPYFAEFIRRWPSVEALAAADEADVMAAWAGLGYYARARNLVACAHEVARRGGVFPESEDELRGLPGLGVYTAAAVAAIAFGKRAVVVDANVERVVARLSAIGEPLPGARAAIRKATDDITPEQRSGDFAQAMMDLGATICTARAPRCLLCPLSTECDARKGGEPERYPVKPAKRVKPLRQGKAYWIERDDAVWLVRRASKGMLAAMRALPDDGWSAKNDGSGPAPLVGDWREGGVVSHTFTHFALELHLSVYSGSDLVSLENCEGEWWRLSRLDDAGLPTLFAKAARLALGQR